VQREQALVEIQRLVDDHALTADDLAAIAGELELERALARRAALATARQLVDFWDIRRHELGGPNPQPAAPAPTVKYEHPVTGDTWDGHGEHPEWLRHALLQEGFRVIELTPGTDEFAGAKCQAVRPGAA